MISSLDDPDSAPVGPPEPSLYEVRERFESAFSNAPIGMALAMLTHPDDIDADADEWERLLAGELSGYQVDISDRKDLEGRLFYHIGHPCPVRDILSLSSG